MTSAVEICNKALIKLGARRITSLEAATDNSKEAALCNRLYPEIRDEMLQSHPWNFAIKRAEIAASTEEPIWEFDNKFPFPSDLLKLLEIKDDPVKHVEDNAILSSADSPLYIRYIARIEDPNKFSSLFIDALASKIALELAEDLTQSNTKIQQMSVVFDTAFARARKADAQEEAKVDPQENSWITARR